MHTLLEVDFNCLLEDLERGTVHPCATDLLSAPGYDPNPINATEFRKSTELSNPKDGDALVFAATATQTSSRINATTRDTSPQPGGPKIRPPEVSSEPAQEVPARATGHKRRRTGV
jgi:hypothetical protein